MKTKARRDLTLLVINASLATVAIVIILLGWWLSVGRQAQVVGTENRFLTTEWYVLQELKAQTDKKLREKDLEIDSLKRRYEGLKALNSSPDLLVRVEEELRAAQAERNALASMGLKSGLAIPSPILPTDTDVAERWKALERTADQWRLKSESLQAQVASLLSRNEVLSSDLAAAVNSPALPPAPETAAVAPPTPDRAQVMAALVLERSRWGTPPPSVLEEVRTKLLVRALLRSPEIQSLYPDLLEGFDRFTEVVAKREYLRGGLDAYQRAIDAVQLLFRD